MKERIKMAKQAASERINNFEEVALGYNEAEALAEAERCLMCKEPTCVTGCPVGIDIKGFIELILKKEYEAALMKIKETNNLPGICGRVCPQETQCESTCRLAKKAQPIAIGRLERFLADLELTGKIKLPEVEKKKILNYKVAVVGSGPAGLTASSLLAKAGAEVVLFESLHELGGVLRYGIPSFRLPRKVLEFEINYIKSLGVKVELNMPIGLVMSIKDLFSSNFSSIFLGLGAGLPQFLNIEGENLNGIYSANEFLTRVNLMHADKFPLYDTPIYVGKKAVVIGGGNVAMDSARVAKRLKAEVKIIYRRSEKELPARKEEYENAKEEGIEFMWLTLPVKFHGRDGKLTKIECIKMKLSSPDTSGRAKPIPIEGSNFCIDADTAIIAIGQSPNPLLTKSTPELKTSDRGTIIVDERMRSSIPHVYAGGDITTGAATVISAMGQAKIAAASIIEDLKA